MIQLAQKYNPQEVENGKYDSWLKESYFTAGDKTKSPYSIVLPPPNVTGKLHIGHALNTTLQDVMARFKRLQGFDVCFVAGMDHAGIATQAVVERKLRGMGIDKYEIGREKFLEYAWDWKKEYAENIHNQWAKLGLSLDYTKERFTLDEGMSDAVLEQFIKLYEKGLIYKGKRMVNWCTSCNTSISDAEVEYKEEPSHLWHIRYKITGSDDKYIEVATTRPETMLGDTAVAVHPDDERYKDLVGKTCILPIMNKEIPIIADDFVEMEFGTGCVKITPAHDMNDYQAGLRHNLEFIEVFDKEFKMGDLVPEYKGMDLKEARIKIVEKLEELGALVNTEDYTHNVAKCERCKNTIEPKVSEQWFVSMKDLAKRAADSVRNGETRFVPQRYEKQYFHWLDNIQDWCISRQLWWGHRIPAYYCKECGEIHVAKAAPEKCTKCGSANLVQDPDTLDTWFSSALWPFSTLGWPNMTEDYKDFYPTQTLVTGFDIITFWISRMMTQGLEFTGEVPFKDVLVHGIVRDSQGRKMSKTLGNGIDPLDVIEKNGTDSLRFSLLSGTTMGNDIRFMPEKLDQASNFANKIWNAAKFITMNLADDEKVREFCYEVYEKNNAYNPDLLKIEDKWILNKFDKLVQDVSKNLDNYDLGIALDKIYGFMWNEFCDWYIEMVKPRIYSESEEERVAVSDILNHVFGSSLKLLHPFMPFVTSEIYSKLICFGTEDLMVSKWPKIRDEFVFDKEEAIIEKMKKLIVEIRNIRTKMNVHPTKKSKLLIISNSIEKEIKEAEEFLLKLGFANEIVIVKDEKEVPQNAVSIVVDELKVFIPFEELVDIEEERKRLEGEKAKLEAEVLRGEKMLSNPGFVNKAPEAKVNEEKAKLENYKQMLQNVEERLKSL